ncbi:hypothetical protein Q0590_10660 [Rhodocytophaga aerolata]|uniref:Uncharacterized protein n=1 Tax=Rhodocytophaga aerolata TaxID=455078 RepID=A0ABT8R3Q2_9BACT|nr:hypothetical protein [Rhodocytophaga aerolata]MDO1446715.1 hypothetical protein [Rhodocytophaga aerolata]
MKRPPELYFLFLLHLLLSLNALVGGGLLIAEPSGSLLGMSPDWLRHTPFTTYLLPGLILFVMVGLFPLLTLFGLLLRANWPWVQVANIYSDKHWAWAYSLFSGIILLTWITVQQLITQYFWLQPILLIMGLLILVFTLLPRVQQYYSLKNEGHVF